MATSARPPLSARSGSRQASPPGEGANAGIPPPPIWPADVTPPHSAPTRVGGQGSKRPMRGKTQSASPRGRPQRLRPMKGGEAVAGKLRLAAMNADDAMLQDVLGSTPDLGNGTAGVPGVPALHEGFYDFAAAVVRPQLTARQHAAQLHEKLESSLQQVEVSYAGSGDGREPSKSSKTRNVKSKTSTAQPAIADASPLPLALLPSAAPEHSFDAGTFATAVPENGDDNSNGLVLVATEGARSSGSGATAGARVKQSERFQKEMELCYDYLEEYIKDTTTDSKERAAFLKKSRSASYDSRQKLVWLTQRCVKDMEDSQGAQKEMQQAMEEVQQENDSLRTMMRHMLAAENQLQADVGDRQLQVDALDKHLEDAHQKTQRLEEELAQVTEELLFEREEQHRRRQDTRDGCNSPMMGFAAFVMSDTHLPGSHDDALVEGSPRSFRRKSSQNNDTVEGARRLTFHENLVTPQSGGPSDMKRQRSDGQRRTWCTGRQSSIDAQRGSKVVIDISMAQEQQTSNGSKPSRLQSIAAPISVCKALSHQDASPASVQGDQEDAVVGTLSMSGGSQADRMDDTRNNAGGPESPRRRQSLIGSQLIAPRLPPNSCLDPAEIPAKSTKARVSVDSSDVDATSEKLLQSEESDATPVAITFPALIPFLDFSRVDGGEVERTAQQETGDQNRQHLSKHIAALQSDYQKEQDENHALQESVDVVLERLHVWVHAVNDSISNGGFGDMVHQDTDALEVCQSAIAWLVGRPCVEWASEDGHYEEVLDQHETRLRQNLARDRPKNAELQDLKRTLAQQKKRGDDLSDQLLELRSSMLGGRSLVKRGADRAATAATIQAPGSSASSVRATPAHQISDSLAVTPSILEGTASVSIPLPAVVARLALSSITPAAGDVSSSRPASASRLGSSRPDSERGAIHEMSSPTKDVRSDETTSAAAQVSHVSVQCDLLSAEAGCLWAAKGIRRASGLPGSKKSILSASVETGEDESVEAGRYVEESPLEDPSDEMAGLHAAAAEEAVARSHSNSVASAADEAAGGRRSLQSQSGVDEEQQAVAENVGDEFQQNDALVNTDAETRRMRLLSSPFVESIDFTMVPCNGQLLLKPGAGDDKLMGLKALSTLIAETYQAKKVDDTRRDKAQKPRKQLHEVLQELLLRQHGVKRVVHQKSWQFAQSVLQHAPVDPGIRLFADFLDGTRDIDELSFYLYCSTLLATAVVEEAAAPKRFPAGTTSLARATRAVDLLFGDLPKAMGVARDELEKCIMHCQDVQHFVEEYGFSFDVPSVEPCLRVDDLHRVLLEGWRMSALLLDETVSGFSWRDCVLAFVRSDQTNRGWLDPHEVRDSEATDFGAALRPDVDGLRLLDRTSLGAFVFRAVHRCTKAASASSVALDTASAAPGHVLVARKQRVEAQKATQEACLQASQLAFESLEKALSVYLSWLMHSEELRDLSVYHSVKARIYGFRRSSSEKKSAEGAHELRCLLLLLLAHQFDVQRVRGDMSAEHLDWELRSLLQILREGWQRGAMSASEGLDFGSDLAELGKYQASSSR